MNRAPWLCLFTVAVGLVACSRGPASFDLHVFNGSGDSLADCVVRFPSKVQPLGTLDPQTGRTHRSLEMEAPTTVTLEWVGPGGTRESETLAVPPLPKNWRPGLVMDIARTPSGWWRLSWKR
jgi:hypothetical protein